MTYRLSKGRRRPRRAGNRRFTLIELLVVVSIIAILAAMLLPALSKARRHVKSVMCVTNLRQFAMMFGIYADDQNAAVPPGMGESLRAAGSTNGYTGVANRGSQFLMFDFRPISLLNFFTTGYIADARMYFCPALDQSLDGGMGHDNVEASTGRTYGGWVDAGHETLPSRFGVLGSYYYRYVSRGPRSTAPVNSLAQIQAANKIDNLADRNPAAMWDSYHSSFDRCCGNLNPGYHRKGYNIAFYDGTVGFLSKEQYDAVMTPLSASPLARYPTNIWLGWTDLWHSAYGIPSGALTAAVDSAWGD